MYNHNGFTLLELLIAAALIGVLAMFATQAFRASASDVRVADAKARALLLKSAAERYYIEYPGAASFALGSTNPLLAFAQPGSCVPTDSSVQNLVNCGFLEYRQVAYDTTQTTAEGTTRSGSVDMWFESASKSGVTVCFKGKGRILDDATYCTNSSGGFDRTESAE